MKIFGFYLKHVCDTIITPESDEYKNDKTKFMINTSTVTFVLKLFTKYWLIIIKNTPRYMDFSNIIHTYTYNKIIFHGELRW